MTATKICNPPGPSPLVYCAIGDSYGFSFEFASADFVETNNDLRYHQHPKFGVRPGVYSDDTQMQMALAEVIASGREWTPRIIAASFVDVFKRDPREGYARRFYNLLQQVKNGDELLATIVPDSKRNGAAMRAPVVGLFSDIHEVIGRSEVQARITHDTKIGVDSAIAAALIMHFFAYDLGPKANLPGFLNKFVPGYGWETDWSGPVAVHGIVTVRAALTAIMRHDTLSDVLRSCVAFTGDVDSVAAVAVAAASGYHKFKKDLPEQLWEGCERSQYGLVYLLDLDRRVRSVTIDEGPLMQARDSCR